MMDRIAKQCELVKEEVGNALSTSPLLIRQYTKHLRKSEGKYIRAWIVLISALDDQDEIAYDAVYIASAIELLHLASLVHDDVMDNADTRRGVVTLHKLYGHKTAVICGDYLLALAFQFLNKIVDKDKYRGADLTDALMELSLGELNQHLNNGNIDLTRKQYFEIINGKTAALFSASAYGGAMVAEVSEEERAIYKEIGRNIGMIFQLLDDCLDFEASASVAKKPVRSDFEQGVVTLPLIIGFEEDKDFKEMAKNTSVSRTMIDSLVTRVAGVEKTKAIAYEYHKEALRLIDSLKASDFKKEALKMMSLKAMRLE